MGVVTLLADVQAYIAPLITAAQNVNADGRILFFECWFVFYGQNKNLKYPGCFRRVCSWRVDLDYLHLDKGLPKRTRQSF